MFSNASIGSDDPVAGRNGTGYSLAIVSHKGGTGRTTAAVGLAWNWGRLGHEVTLLDLDPNGSATRLTGGRYPWEGVTVADHLSRLSPTGLNILDTPALTESRCRDALRVVDGALLTCLADPLALRTLPVATRAVEDAMTSNPKLRLLGIVLTQFQPDDPLQAALFDEIQEECSDLLVGALMYRPELRDWPLRPGSPPPRGREEYRSLGEIVRRRAGHPTPAAWIPTRPAVSV